MDLGSMLCLPKNPRCLECPLVDTCQGQEEPELYTQTKKIIYETLDLFYGVYIQNNKLALKTSTENMYKDMLVLPSVEPIEENFIAKFKHSYTKYRLSVYLYTIEEVDEDIMWLDLDALKNAPISSLTKKAISYLKVSLFLPFSLDS